MIKGFQLANADCKEAFKYIEDESVDLIVVDPPYKVLQGGKKSWNEQHKNKDTIFKENDGKIFEYNDIDIEEWIEDCYRVLKDNSHIYIMTNFLNLTHYLNVVQDYFRVHNLLIWKKNNCTPNRWYMKDCEYIIFAYKGKAKSINNPGTKTVLEFANPKDRTHPTEKPVDLLECLIDNSSNKGDTVLDFAMGTGSCGVACKHLKRKFIGIEIDKKYFKIAKRRIETE